MSNKTPFFLVFHSTYTSIQIGLFSGKTCIFQVYEDKKQASKNILLLVDNILKKAQIQLSDCAFIAAHQGPAPFTTLRVVITTVNGVGLAAQLPLIGVNGLYALLYEHADKQTEYTVALLNAFCDDVYFGIYKKDTHEIITGYTAIQDLPQIIRPQAQVTFMGNGVLLCTDFITATWKNSAIKEPLPEICSLQELGKIAYAKWQRQENITHQILPLYLKESSARSL